MIKYVKILMMLTVWAQVIPAFAAQISLVQSTSSYTGNTPQSKAFTSNNTQGDLIFVGVQSAGSIPSVTDSNNNTYLPIKNITNSPTTQYIFYAQNIKGGANTVTVTFSGGFDGGFHISEWKGVNKVSSLITSAIGGSSGTAMSTANLNTSYQDKTILLIAFGGSESAATTFTAGTNFTLLTVQPNHASGVEYRIVGAGSNYPVMMTESVSQGWAMLSAAFVANDQNSAVKESF